ncbi:MAG: hypothetical protein LIP09_10975 [Bacteroidales bacterium]|nr:hypothetical protein [Bacteroidales bacterium]
MNELNLNADEVILHFICPECQELNETVAFGVPSPNWESETIRDSINTEEYEHTCPNCEKEFEIVINNSIGGGEVEISPEVDNLTVEEIFLQDQE